MVLSGVCWWGCCLGLFPAMGKQCFAISALQRTFLPISMIQVSIIPSPASLQCFSHCYTCTLLDISEICITLPPPWFQTSPIYSLLLFLQPFLVPSLKSDLCFPLETSSAPSCRLHFSFPVALLSVFYLFPDSQYLDSSPCLQESLRREVAKQGAEERALTCRLRTLAKAAAFQWGVSEFWIVPAKSAQLPCCQPQPRSHRAPQPWRFSSLLSPLCILSAVGWHRVIETCPSRVSSIRNSHQPVFKYRGDRELRRAARMEASALSLLANSVFLKHISSCACYTSALLLKMSSSNINHESNESIYSTQACMGETE